MIKKLTAFAAAFACAAALGTAASAADFTTGQSVTVSDSYIEGDLNIYLYNQMPNGGGFNINQNVNIENSWINGGVQIFNINSGQPDDVFRGDFRGMPPRVF
ncbi:MAG: hypothetical protein LUF26_03105 [Firmicutes bacterium]|nr:hypothetical protein [Bacillota bacterium]